MLINPPFFEIRRSRKIGFTSVSIFTLTCPAYSASSCSSKFYPETAHYRIPLAWKYIADFDSDFCAMWDLTELVRFMQTTRYQFKSTDHASVYYSNQKIIHSMHLVARDTKLRVEIVSFTFVFHFDC